LSSKVDESQGFLAAVTDGSGHALIDTFSEQALVAVAKDGWRATQQLPVTAAVPKPGIGTAEAVWSLDFTIEQLRASDVVSGSVVDEVDRSIPGVAITWFSGAGRVRHRGFLTRSPAPETVVSDGAGRFQVPMCGERGQLRARKEGLAERWLTLEPADYVLGLKVVMTAEAVVGGTVVDQDGYAVGGAQVEGGGAGETPRRTMTNANGRFLLRGLRAGGTPSSEAPHPGLQVSAFHPAKGSVSQWVEIPIGRMAETRLALRGDTIPGAVHRGPVPISSVRVRVRGTIRSLDGIHWEDRSYDVFTSDPDGRFAIARPNGNHWSLLIEPPDGPRSTIAAYEMRAADLPPFLDIDLERIEAARGTIRLVVVDADGHPVDSYWLRMESSDTKIAPLSMYCASSDGSADALVPAGAYDVAVSARGAGLLHRVGTVTVAANGVQDLGNVVVEPPGAIDGTVEPPSGGAAGDLFGLIVAHDTTGPTPIMCATGFREWHIEDLAPGKYTLEPGGRSLIDFDSQAVDVRSGKRERVQLFGRPCWHGAVYVRVAGAGGGPCVVEFRNCKGQNERRTVDAAAVQGGVVRIDAVHLVPGMSTIWIGAVGSPLTEHKASNEGVDSLWIDFP
jgi:hypothetical protein